MKEKEREIITREMIKGFNDKATEAGTKITGGQSVMNPWPMIGGTAFTVLEKFKVVFPNYCEDGDVLVLTKPFGTGVISTAVKFVKAKAETVDAALKVMMSSARNESIAMQETGVNACTDITGFGFLGHAFELAKASNVTLKIESNKIPLLPDVLDLIEQNMLTRGDKNNRKYVGNTIKFGKNITKEMQSALFDPQTAGGLLISLEERKAIDYLKKVTHATIIGRVKKAGDYLLEIK